ncbi:MAG: peptidase M15 [Nitriliruptorales bacterium]|nr:peptidase M15 [Nitriliruptorales bacterium]
MASAPDGNGYWLVSAAGQVHAYGSAKHHGDSPDSYRGTIVDLAATPDGSGYWITSSSGQIFSYGSARHHGGAARSGSDPVTGITSTPTGEGYWQVVADHQVSPNGDARFFGTLLLDEAYDRKYPSFTGTVGAWGGHTNGRIPSSLLCRVERGDHRLRCDAATALLALDAAFREEFNETLRVTDTYRSYDGQVRTRGRWCQQRMCYKAAIPGTSNHGWGLAIDIGSGVNSFGTPQHEWMRQNAGQFGWIHPLWAQQGGSNPEPWHWEFTGTG